MKFADIGALLLNRLFAPICISPRRNSIMSLHACYIPICLEKAFNERERVVLLKTDIPSDSLDGTAQLSKNLSNVTSFISHNITVSGSPNTAIKSTWQFIKTRVAKFTESCAEIGTTNSYQ